MKTIGTVLLAIIGLVLIGGAVIVGAGCAFAPGEKQCQALSALTSGLRP